MNSPDTVDITSPDLGWGPPSSYRGRLTSRVESELLQQGSLTARVKQLAGHSFQLQVREQCWRELETDSLRAQFGPIAHGHKFWSRKIAMLGEGVDWILAHTLMPAHAADGPLAAVFSLNNKPLGEYLFEQPGLLRANFQLCRSASGHWGRRSLFFLHGKPIMVAEFFTADFFAHTNTSSAKDSAA
ncbi:MAG: chorismate lyase [Pseudomonadales bacterium]|nr:chorismate lyase [Pseudomonadales bacterium]